MAKETIIKMKRELTIGEHICQRYLGLGHKPKIYKELT